LVIACIISMSFLKHVPILTGIKDDRAIYMYNHILSES